MAHGLDHNMVHQRIHLYSCVSFFLLKSYPLNWSNGSGIGWREQRGKSVGEDPDPNVNRKKKEKEKEIVWHKIKIPAVMLLLTSVTGITLDCTSFDGCLFLQKQKILCYVKIGPSSLCLLNVSILVAVTSHPTAMFCHCALLGPSNFAISRYFLF